jgi:hypothetical protein
MSELIDLKSLVPAPKKPGKKPVGRPKKTSLLPPLDIDFSLDPADQILPCHDLDQARHLEWYVTEVRATNRRLRMYESLPMICQASGCYWASMCPTRPDFMFEGLRCPLEIMEIYRTFVSYVRELKVQPDDYVDLKMVADLVRIDLTLMRMDQEIQVKGMWVDQTAGIVQGRDIPKAERAILDQVINPLIAAQSKLRDDRNKLYKSLLASRDAKKKIEMTEKRQEQDFLKLLTQMHEKLNESKKAAETPVIEAVAVLPALPPAPDEIVEPNDDEPDPF